MGRQDAVHVHSCREVLENRKARGGPKKEIGKDTTKKKENTKKKNTTRGPSFDKPESQVLIWVELRPSTRGVVEKRNRFSQHGGTQKT